MTIISIAFEKGGVAKTATTFTLATELAKQGIRTLAVDADPQGSLTICFGLERETIENDLSTLIACEIETSEYPPRDKCVVKIADNLDLIPAKSELNFVKESLEKADDRDRILRYILQNFKDDYDIILIDNSPSLNLLTKNSLVASDYILITAIPDKLSSEGMNETIYTVSQIRRRLNPQLDILGILFTLADLRTTNDREYIEIKKEEYKFIKFFESIIPSSTEVKKGIAKHTAITDFKPNNPVSLAYKEFVEEFKERLNL